MKAVILAAGIASRLRPLTDYTPKCLLKIGDISILERTITNLLNYSIDEIIIVTGYREKQIIKFIDTAFPSIKVTFIYNKLYDSTNNIYSLWLTKNYIKNTDILLLDSDIIFDHRIIRLLLDSGTGNYLAVRDSHDIGADPVAGHKIGTGDGDTMIHFGSVPRTIALDTGNAIDDTEITKEAFFLWKPYKFEKLPDRVFPGDTTWLARRTVLGKPKLFETAAK